MNSRGEIQNWYGLSVWQVADHYPNLNARLLFASQVGLQKVVKFPLRTLVVVHEGIISDSS